MVIDIFAQQIQSIFLELCVNCLTSARMNVPARPERLETLGQGTLTGGYTYIVPTAKCHNMQNALVSTCALSRLRGPDSADKISSRFFVI
jgi:hypothetical protein